MKFPSLGLRNAYIVLTVICFIAVAFSISLFSSNCDVRNSAPIIILDTDRPEDGECRWTKLLDPAEVPLNQSIFFIETNRQASAHQLMPRQACSVESAARINPDRLVFVLFLSGQFECTNDTMSMASLQHYPNIRFRHIDLSTYVYGTLLEDFIRSGIMERGLWQVEQHSDMLRLLTLWKFGGIYMDLDVVSLKPMPLVNFIGAEYPENLLASCVIGMQSRDTAEEAIRMFIDGWDGEVWIKNGPLLLTNLMRKHCKTNDVPSMYAAKCDRFIVYPPDMFGPIAWYDWETFFNSSQVEYVKKKLKRSMAIHFWNKMTKERLIDHKSLVPYTYVASENCPKVFGTVVDYF